MNCTNLAATGPDVGYLVVAAALILLAGFLLVLFARKGRKTRAAALITALMAFGIVCAPLGGAPAAQAAVSCEVQPGPANSLTIIQTSVMNRLAPDRAPAPITGLVTNNSADDTYIVDVVVSIAGVTKAAGASAGVCDASDYVLVAPLMPVAEALAGGASTTFGGASIGFADKPTNQDACQGATVTLLYTVG